MKDHDQLFDTICTLAQSSWKTGTYNDKPYKQKTVKRMVENDKLPEEALKRGEADPYRVKMIISILKDLLHEDEETAYSKLEEWRQKEMPSNLPSDGSKGQWRLNKKVKTSALEWFCEE
jgi:hypothetical protein